MAVKIITNLIDDLTGETADTTIGFGYAGTDYTIDLSEKNATKMRKSLDRFVQAARRIPRTRTQPPTAPRRPIPNRIEDTPGGRSTIRIWAHSTGRWPDLARHGRIPQDIIDAYHATTGIRR